MSSQSSDSGYDSRDSLYVKAKKTVGHLKKNAAKAYRNVAYDISESEDYKKNIKGVFDEIKETELILSKGQSAVNNEKIRALFKETYPGSTTTVYDRFIETPLIDEIIFKEKINFTNLNPYTVYATEVTKGGEKLKFLFFLGRRISILYDVDEEDPTKVKEVKDLVPYIILKNENGEPVIREFDGSIFDLTKKNFKDIAQIAEHFPIDVINNDFFWDSEIANSMLKDALELEFKAQLELGDNDSVKFFSINPDPGLRVGTASMSRRGPLSAELLHELSSYNKADISGIPSLSMDLTQGSSTIQQQDREKSQRIGKSAARASALISNGQLLKTTKQHQEELAAELDKKRKRNAGEEGGSLKKTKKKRSKKHRKTKKYRKTNKRRKHRSNKSKKHKR